MFVRLEKKSNEEDDSLLIMSMENVTGETSGLQEVAKTGKKRSKNTFIVELLLHRCKRFTKVMHKINMELKIILFDR